MTVTAESLKGRVKQHWEQEVCGSRWGKDLADDRRRYFAEIERTRYQQDYMLPAFADFEKARGLKVLEIGLGTGTDFVRWCRAGAVATGRDLTDASVQMVKERLTLEALQADVATGDAENLEFPDNSFDLYYSWGVLHHTPDTERTIAEAYRVLKPGGTLKIMLYHYPSVGALLVWMLYGPLRGRFVGPRTCIFENVESPGTKMYTRKEAAAMVGRHFRGSQIEVRTFLGSGDLLSQELSAKYQGRKWRIIKALYPRWFVKGVLGHRWGAVMTIKAVKQGTAA